MTALGIMAAWVIGVALVAFFNYAMNKRRRFAEKEERRKEDDAYREAEGNA